MTDEGTLDDLYLEWLYTHYIGAVANRNPERSYWELAKQLYQTKYYWKIHNDSNRAEDGKALRDEFIVQCDIQDIEIGWLQLECSVLEMLIGLACRASFLDDDVAGNWFWRFLTNLGLKDFNDRVYNQAATREVDAVIKRLLDRTYEKNGDGGLFPLHNARHDQTSVELWYQLQQYMLEVEPLASSP